MGRLQALRHLPGHRHRFLDCQRLVAGVLFQRSPLEIVHHQVRPRLVGAAGKAAVLDADNRRMVQRPQRLGLAEELIDAALKIVARQRLDHHIGVHVLVTAQKGDAETAGPEDALRHVLVEGKRSEAGRVELGGSPHLVQGRVPVAPLQGSAIGVEMSFGLRPRIGDQPGHGVEVALGAVEVAGRHLQLADGVQQRRQAVPLLVGQGAVAGHQALDELAFTVVADRQTIARPQFRVHQIETVLQLQHGAVDVACLLALPLLLGADVEDGIVGGRDCHLEIAEQLFETLALLGEHLRQTAEAAFQTVLKRLQLGEGETLEEAMILLDVAAEEEAGGHDEHRRSALWPQGDKGGEVVVTGRAQVVGHLAEGLAFGIKEGLGIVVTGKGTGLAGKGAGIEGAGRQHVGFGGGTQFAQTVGAEGGLAVQLRERTGVEEGPQLFAEGLVIGGGEDQLALVPEGVAGQGDFQGFPGLFVGAVQRLEEGLAVVGETLGEEVEDSFSGAGASLTAEGLAGAADELLESEGTQVLRDAHGLLVGGWGAPSPAGVGAVLMGVIIPHPGEQCKHGRRPSHAAQLRDRWPLPLAKPSPARWLFSSRLLNTSTL